MPSCATQDERDLGAVDGMNVFAAAVILASVTLDDFLNMAAEERLEQFGHLIGKQRIVSPNPIYGISCRRLAIA
jgi:hypothetical protein